MPPWIPPITIQQSVYKTPRAFLIEYLNNDTDNNVAQWIVRNESFQYDVDKLMSIWASSVRPTMCKELTGNDRYIDVNYCDFERGIFSSAPHVGVTYSWMRRRKLMTTLKEKRYIVNDLTVGPFFEWMLRFLLEESRTDWIDFSDKNKKEFRFYDMEGMWKMYTYVHDNTKTSSMYYLKMLLSSYCLNGILIEIDKKTNCYQFHDAWYQKELMRTMEVTLPEQRFFDDTPRRCESFAKFPNHTGSPRTYI